MKLKRKKEKKRNRIKMKGQYKRKQTIQEGIIESLNE
jgi:hypothetical protein